MLTFVSVLQALRLYSQLLDYTFQTNVLVLGVSTVTVMTLSEMMVNLPWFGCMYYTNFSHLDIRKELTTVWLSDLN